MSSYTIPGLLTADLQHLTASGEVLVKFLKRQVAEMRADGRLDADNTSALECYRLWYAVVLKNPPSMTPEQFIARSYQGDTTYDKFVGQFWLAYLTSLDPVARARAENPPPAPAQESTMQPAKSAHTVRLNESTQETTMNTEPLTHGKSENLTETGRLVARYLRLRLSQGIPVSSDQQGALLSYAKLVEAGPLQPGVFFQAFPAYADQLAALVESDSAKVESDMAAAALGNVLAQLK